MFGRAAGLRSRGARRSCLGFDCEPWQSRFTLAVDSARLGLARDQLRACARNHSSSRLRCPLVQERRRPRFLVASDFFSSHIHITSIHRLSSPARPRLITTTQTTPKNPHQIHRNGTQGRIRTQTPPKHALLRDIYRALC